jgi:hypothetical protein
VGILEVRWDWGGTEPADDYAFFYRNWNESHEIGKGFFVCMGIIPAEDEVCW